MIRSRILFLSLRRVKNCQIVAQQPARARTFDDGGHANARRLIAVLLMLVGIGLMSTLAASITSHFVQQTANTELKDLSARLERIEGMLQQLQHGSVQE
jgi:hypothetical protein